MRQVQIVRAIFAILFLFLGILLFCYASQYEGTWHIIVEDLGLVIAVIGAIAAILYMREFYKGFSWDNPRPKPKMTLVPQKALGQPGSGKTCGNQGYDINLQTQNLSS